MSKGSLFVNECGERGSVIAMVGEGLPLGLAIVTKGVGWMDGKTSSAATPVVGKRHVRSCRWSQLFRLLFWG